MGDFTACYRTEILLARQYGKKIDVTFSFTFTFNRFPETLTMQIGMIGLGRMGGDMTRRLQQGGHTCVVHDRNTDSVVKLQQEGAIASDSLEDLLSKLAKPRVIWMMLPAAVVDQELMALTALLESGDIIIDGGNSYYRDDIRRGKELRLKGIHYVDVGTSGGVFGRERGYCLMIGGEKEIVNYLTPVFATLAPGINSAPRTANRETNKNSTAEEGFLHCGPQGAGHFVKMVHNGIEYALMGAYAEGMNILRHADAGNHTRDADAETSPLLNPEYYQYEFDLPEIAEVWRRGSVISSWLLDLTATALLNNADLSNYEGRVSDSGEGRWTVAAAVEEGVPAPLISAALFGRFESRGEADYANRLLSAMRKQFGGHDEKN
jgi:6-phosphogluconate dehydrogenase